MCKRSRIAVVATVGLMLLLIVCAGQANAQRPTLAAAGYGGCPPVPCCCEDAHICVVADVPPVCYTENGVHTFIRVFEAAATKGMENAVIRGFNATTASPACKDCGPKK
jgi:hypothetical protein